MEIEREKKTYSSHRMKYIGSYLKYKLENFFTHGLIFIIPLLVFITIFIVLIFSIIYYFTEKTDTYEDALWETFTRTIDPCAAADDEGIKHRIISGIVVVCGLVIIAVLIGTIATFMDEKLNELKKGHSSVIETNHTIILGWSPEIFDILNELIIANESQRNPSIVILTSIDYSQIEYMIKGKITNSKNTRIIYRNGDPMSITDLNKLSLNQARSIIILTAQNQNPDSRTIKTILAIRNNSQRNNVHFHIVAEIKDKIYFEAALIAGGDEAVFVNADEIIARIIAHSCQQSGLTVILSTLLSFDDDEIYFKYEESLVGQRFVDALFAYEKCSAIGLMLADGTVELCPRLDTIIHLHDQIILIAEDDDKIALSSSSNKQSFEPISSRKSLQTTIRKQIEKNLILGWNSKGPLIAKELDTFVAYGSQLHILTNSQQINQQLINELNQQKVFIHSGSLTKKSDLEKLDLFSFNYIILLANDRNQIENSHEDDDAECLICLLYLKSLIEQNRREKSFGIIAEIHDIRNCLLSHVSYADDFIVSPNLISKYISQLSENKNIKKVYDLLLTSDGPEIHLCSPSIFIQLDTPITYGQILKQTLKYQCLAIGYRLFKYSHDQTKLYGIVLNPNKQQIITLSHDDKIIILAEKSPPSPSEHMKF